MTGAPSAVTLRAIEGEPLRRARIRDMVVATAHAIAERQGIEVLDVRTEPDAITVTLEASRIASYGFAAELRRITTKWYADKFGAPSLWGDAPAEDREGS